MKKQKKFTELQTTICGNFGEDLILKEFGNKHNLKIYIQQKDNSSYPVDAIALYNGKAYGIEVKTKPRFKFFDKTGMDTPDHTTYMEMNIDVYVLFVDYIEKKIYGNWIKKLDKHKKIEGNITTYPLSEMKVYRNLTDKEVDDLKELSRSNYYR